MHIRGLEMTYILASSVSNQGLEADRPDRQMVGVVAYSGSRFTNVCTAVLAPACCGVQVI